MVAVTRFVLSAADITMVIALGDGETHVVAAIYEPYEGEACTCHVRAGSIRHQQSEKGRNAVADLKAEIKEIVDLVALVPEPLQAMCFEMLLKDALAKRHSPPKHPPAPSHTVREAEPKVPTPAAAAESANEAESASTPAAGVQPKVNGGSDITMSDLHMKTKRFMTNGGVTLEHVNNVFYKEGDNFELLITDFGARSMADGQMRIAMLQALHQALIDGEFTTTVEAVREECKMRKCLDAPNFAKNFRTNAEIFDFGEWSKSVTDLRLSDDGKKALAEVVKKLS